MIHSRKRKQTFYSPITFLLVLLTLFSLTVVYDSNHIISTLSSLVLRRRMEPPTTPSPVSVKLALPKREEMYKTRVAICALSKSKPTWQYVHDTSVYNLFLAGIHRTTRMHTQYDIQIHIGVDADDVFWSKKDNFNALVLAAARAFDLKVTVHHYDKKQPNHLPMNELMRDAARAGAEYLVRLNDDTEIRSMSWIPLAVHQLSAYDPPNVGVVGPVCREGKTSILTHDMVHRTHLEIFDTYYPPNFHNWYVDDWISAVYGPERTTKIPDWVVHHYVSPPRYNPIMVSNETLQASIREGKDRIQAYLSRRNVSRKLSQVTLRVGHPRVIDSNIDTTSNDCAQPASVNFAACKASLAKSLDMDHISCPAQCVTFSEYGRFNNFVIALTNAIRIYVLSEAPENRRKIYIDASISRKFDLGNIYNVTELEKLCVFTSKESPTCEVISGKSLFETNFSGLFSDTAFCMKSKDCLLVKAWLLFGAVHQHIHNQVSSVITKVGSDYSTLHSRFLEDTCESRHKQRQIPVDYCHMKPQFIANTLKELGHAKQKFFVCSDKQHMEKVNAVLQYTNGNLSPFNSVIHDTLLMINSRRFIRNRVSTMSLNIYQIRFLFDHANRLPATLKPTTKTVQYTDQFQASLKCDGVSIVHQSSTTTEGSRETIFPAPKNNNMEQLCKKLKHWDFCRNKLSVITQRHPISKLNVITEWKNAYIDGGSCKGTLGFPFTSQCIGMFHGHCPHLPSNMLHGKTIHRYDAIATTLQHYYKSAGHWPAEQLPSLLRFLKELDQDVKILVSINDCKLCRKYINELVRLGVLKSQDRLINWEGSKQDHSHVYFGKRVFHHYPWPWEDGQNPYRAAVLRGPQDLELVRSTFLGRIPEKIVPASDGKIVVIQRIESRRHTINHDKLVLDLRKIYSNVVIFSTPGDTLQEDVEVFRDASAVIAVHGAGLMNMLWCSPGTVVVEVCYTSGMPCPDMYYFMAVNLQLDYYVSVGSGDYNGGVSVDVADITLLLKKSLKSKTFSKKFREKKHTWLSQEKAFQHEVSVLQRLNSVTPPCGQSHIPRILNLDTTNLILTTPWYGTSLDKPEGMKQFCKMELKSIDAWAKCVDDHLAVANVSYHDHHGSGKNLVISESQLTLIDFGIADMDDQKRLPSKYLNHRMTTRELTREIYNNYCNKSKQLTERLTTANSTRPARTPPATASRSTRVWGGR